MPQPPKKSDAPSLKQPAPPHAPTTTPMAIAPLGDLGQVFEALSALQQAPGE